jgi:hypothetical protein
MSWRAYSTGHKGTKMDLDAALTLVREHFHHAKQLHPETKDLQNWQALFTMKLQDLAADYHNTAQSNHRLVAGKRALQIAAMALRAIEDLDLGLLGPE